MVAQTMEICLSAISAVFNFMSYIFEELGAWSWILGAIIVYTIFRLLIVPIVGGVISAGQSDTVKAFRQSYQDGKNGRHATFEDMKKGKK